MNIFGKTRVSLFLAAVMLASCSSVQSTPTLSQADKMETAISTVSTALAETQPALPTPSPSPSRAPSNTPRPPTPTNTPSPTPLPIVSPEVIDWEETTSLPIASSSPFNDARGQQIIFHNGYIYIFGGSSANDSQATKVYFSAIGQDGTLAEWVETTSLPGKYHDHVVVKTGEYVYLLTGAAGAEDVFYAPFNANGSIGTWKKTASLSPSRQQLPRSATGTLSMQQEVIREETRLLSNTLQLGQTEV